MFAGVIQTSRADFLKSPRFKIYARLFAEVVNQVIRAKGMAAMADLVSIVEDILFKKHGAGEDPKANLSWVELRYSLLSFTIAYLKRQNQNGGLHHISNYYLIMEA